MAPQREWFEKDYYKTLGVSSTATAKEITSAYRKLAKKHHPDANPGHEDEFKEISAAYDVLNNADTRKEYDEVRTMGPAAGGFPGGFGGPGGPGGATYRAEDLGDKKGRFVRRLIRGNEFKSSERLPFVGGDVELELRDLRAGERGDLAQNRRGLLSPLGTDVADEHHHQHDAQNDHHDLLILTNKLNHQRCL